MSKYRLEVAVSRVLPGGVFLLFGLLAMSVWLWQPTTFTYQVLLQAVLSILLLIQGYQLWQRFLRHSSCVVMLDEQGVWQELDGLQRTLLVGQRSRMTSVFLWLELLPFSRDTQGHWLWLDKTQLPDADFRRVCRVIARQQVSADDAD